MRSGSRWRGGSCRGLTDTRVVVLEVGEEVIANACPGPRIFDGIGEAAYIRGQDLAQVSIVETVEWVQ